MVVSPFAWEPGHPGRLRFGSLPAIGSVPPSAVVSRMRAVPGTTPRIGPLQTCGGLQRVAGGTGYRVKGSQIRPTADPTATRRWTTAPNGSGCMCGFHKSRAPLAKAQRPMQGMSWRRHAQFDVESWCRRGSGRTSYVVTFLRRYSSLPLASPTEAAMLAAEATPWLLPRCHRVATAPDHAVTLRFKAGRALDAQEAGLDLF